MSMEKAQERIWCFLNAVDPGADFDRDGLPKTVVGYVNQWLDTEGGPGLRLYADLTEILVSEGVASRATAVLCAQLCTEIAMEEL